MTDVSELRPEAYTLAVDSHSVWLQGNRLAGNTSETALDGEENRARLQKILQPYVARAAVAARLRHGPEGLVTVDDPLLESTIVYASSVSTNNPANLLQANPADCGQVAAWGLSQQNGLPAIGLFHASRRIVNSGSYLRALDSFCTRYDITPDALHIRLGPSARKDSYAFPDIEESQIRSGSPWNKYVDFDETTAMWHVDFHGRTVDELLAYGVRPRQLRSMPIDTIANPSYYSAYNAARGKDSRGFNGLFFAIREPLTTTPSILESAAVVEGQEV
jgi:copper oxidase (laccase) domain-containing protein